ncbi:MAG: TIGR04076 family protein [Butyricicoccaceae bacterium]
MAVTAGTKSVTASTLTPSAGSFADGDARCVPYIDILRYGGHLPGQEDGTAVFCCPDVDTINVFRIEMVE